MSYQHSPGGAGGGGNVPRDKRGRMLDPHIVDPREDVLSAEDRRAPGFLNDSGIVRIKDPWVHKEYSIPAPIGPADFDPHWSGPSRSELHIKKFQYRKESGDSFQSSEGMHTMIPRFAASAKPKQMQTGRVDRISPVNFQGQNYSQTTLIQGSIPRGKK